jgi:hypothetical protein
MPTGWRVASENERPGGRGKTKTMGMTIKINYRLSETGRRASLLAGGTGRERQSIEVAATPELLAIASIDADGAASYDLTDEYLHGVTHRSPSVDSLVEDPSAEALKVAAARKAGKERAEAERLMRVSEQRAIADREHAERKDRITRVVDLMATIPASEWALHTTYGKTPYLREVTPNPGPDHVSAKADELPTEARASAEIELSRRQKEEADRKAAEAAAVIAERDAWILAHGSTRLQKGFAAGLVDKMGGVYRDERIFHDIGADWIAWKDAIEPDDNDLLNPSEAELDALADVAKKFPGARLASVGGTSRDGEEHDWRPAIMIGSCPWDDGLTVIKYLD